MFYAVHISAGFLKRRALGAAFAIACAVSPSAAAAGQQAPPPAAAPQTPAAVNARPQSPAPPRAVQGGAAQRAPRTPPAAPAPTAPRAPAPAAPQSAPATPTAAAQPREVVTVVHRLTGWKLLAWLAASGPAVELDELPSLGDAHTNIVAGYIYDDGRSVAARLPQAEVELEAFTAPPMPPGFFAPHDAALRPEPEYLLVTADGRRVEAKFVGLDAATGLTLLEAGERLFSGSSTGDQGDTEDPTVGQRVRLYAPAPAAPAPASARAASRPPDPNYIYLSIDHKEGLLTQVVQTPSNRPSRLVASANVSQAWTGAVAANELGEVVGIVSQSRGGETQIVPIATVRGACERVLRLRGSVPQAWLGARGDAAFQVPLDAWVNFDWTAELARPHIERRRGVLLTSVAPGTPAALAGLKPGDLIAGVGAREVRGVEDLSFTLKEAGVGSTVDLTVWRALAPEPLKVSVELKGAKSPAVATAEAEERAVRDAVALSQREVAELRSAEAKIKSADVAELSRLRSRLEDAEARLAVLREKLELARAKVSMSRAFVFGGGPAAPRPAEAPGGFAVATRLRMFGLNAIGLSPVAARPLGAKGGMLVVAVRPESPAAASGLAAGDVIETVNGRPLLGAELRGLLAAPDTSTLSLGLVRGGRRLSVNFSPSFAGEPRR